MQHHLSDDQAAQDSKTMKNLRTVVLSLVGVAIGLIIIVTVIA